MDDNGAWWSFNFARWEVVIISFHHSLSILQVLSEGNFSILFRCFKSSISYLPGFQTDDVLVLLSGSELATTSLKYNFLRGIKWDF